MEKNNGNPACASCKHQRKKCTEKCILAPLFPASKNREFQAVHKFFGVSNVTKIVKNLREEDRMRAVNSLVWEAVCRQRDPVLGPYAEYARIYEELQLYKSFQLSTQGGMMYKPKPNFGGWNNSNNKSVGVHNCDNNGTYKYINGNGYNSMITDYQMGQENDAGSVVLSPPQQNSINEFNYHYYLPDEKYYTSSVIKCKDGSSSFTKDRLNDNFCDCVDGTDEPGTTACPNGKFYYCCDGSDEYASGAICPSTCVMGGNVAYKRISYGLTNDLDFTGVNVIEKEVVTEDSIQKISGLNIAIIVLSLVVALWLFYRRVKSEEKVVNNMLLKKAMPLNRAYVCCFPYNFFRGTHFRLFSSLPATESSAQAAVESNIYEQIPYLIDASKESLLKPNPFSFLSTIPHHRKPQIIDEILQSLISAKPQHRTQPVYPCLLSYSLQNPNPLPIAFAILQSTLRSGCSPVPQTRLSFSNAWLDRRCQSDSVPKILLEMKAIGYHPDTDTCNYLITSLCAVDQLNEAVNILEGMSGAGCVPNLESYDPVICKMCRARKIKDVF